MSEEQIIRTTTSPRTRESLADDLRRLGVTPGMTLVVHSSLSSLGWVSGGPVGMVQALMDVVTDAGTIVMPTHTSEYSDPAQWENPPVAQAWWQIIYDTMPVFDPQITSASSMGRIAEAFRTWPGVLRSNHPTVSFAAWGRHAHSITARHTLEYELGEGSPLARVYDLDGRVLLLGVGYDRNTASEADHLMKLVTTALEWSYEAGEMEVRAEMLEKAADLFYDRTNLHHRSGKIQVWSGM